ncbi:MAG: hypothetical protein JXQ87_18095 [Bacteroidia bacterium]
MPKVILIILALFALTKFTKAEYGGVYIKYELSLKSGEKKSCYREYSGYKEEFDILIEDGLMPLSFLFSDQDSVRFYKDMLKYKYHWWYSESAMIQRGITNPFYLKTAKIESAKVLDMYSFSYMMGFGTSHSLADSVWMNQPVVDTASAGGYLCFWQIFVHEHNVEVERLLDQLREIQQPLKDLIKESNQIRKKYGFGYEYDEVNRKIDSIQNSNLEDQISEIIGELNRFKVVVIEECSC